MALTNVSSYAALGNGLSGFGLVEYTVPLPKHMMVEQDTIIYSFRIGLNGAGREFGEDQLYGAEGDTPNVIVYDNQAAYLGEVIGRKGKCSDGADNCVQYVKDIQKQPAYGLLVGGDDEVCLASATVTYPGGDQYGWVGNWAHTCGRPWYYSDMDAKYEHGTVKLDCMWLGGNGVTRGFSTGVRIHFPEFAKGYTANGNSEDYYCREPNTALAFFNHTDPWYFNGDSKKVRKQRIKNYVEKDWPEEEKDLKGKKKLRKAQLKKEKSRFRHEENARKAKETKLKKQKDREELLEKEKEEMFRGREDRKAKKLWRQKERKRIRHKHLTYWRQRNEGARRFKKRIKLNEKRSSGMEASGMERRSIQSYHAQHSATYLCQNKDSFGPSLVSMEERTFCYMTEKVLYAFCADIASGKCWDHEAHKFDAKGNNTLHARATLPDIQFEKPVVWGKKK